MNAVARDAIRDWAAAASGCTAIWANQDAARPAYPYVSLSVLSNRQLGRNEVEWTRDEARDPGSQMRPTYSRRAMSTVSLSVLSVAEEFSGSAEEIVDSVISSLQEESVLALLRAAKVAFIRDMNPRNQAERVEGRWLSRWGTDIEFATIYERTPTDQDIGFVEKTVISSTLSGQTTSVDLDEEEFGNVT